MKASVAKRTLDNITVVMVAFAHFKKLAFPSSMPDANTIDERKEPSKVNENTGKLNGRKSEELPDTNQFSKLYYIFE